MKSISQQIEELRQMSVPELVDRYQELWGKNPHCKNREWLWKRCGWRLQEQRLGGLSNAAKHRLEELISEIDIPLGEKQRSISGILKRSRKPNEPAVGTVLVRQWRGEEYHLKVVEGGYELDGVVHRSLSAAARALTCSRWNGRLFWGLDERKKKK